MNHFDPLYFDYNASSLLCDAVRRPTFLDSITGANPSAMHRCGRQASALLERCRAYILAEFNDINPSDYNVIFTSGGTESNNTALYGFEGPVLVAATEHQSVVQCRPDATIAPVDSNGVVDLNFIQDWISKQKHGLISVMYANNETGVLQPVQEISTLCHQKGGIKFHCDIVQAFGKVPIALNLFDTVSISAHKLGGFAGAGCLIYKTDFQLNPLLRGGRQQHNFRAGTENVVGALSLMAGLQDLQEIRKSQSFETIAHIRNGLEDEIMKISPETMIFSKTVKRMPHVSMLTMPNVSTEKQIIFFDLEGISVGTGAACSSGMVQASHVLLAMGADPVHSRNAIRISMGPRTRKQDVDKLFAVWQKIFYSVPENNHAVSPLQKLG